MENSINIPLSNLLPQVLVAGTGALHFSLQTFNIGMRAQGAGTVLSNPLLQCHHIYIDLAHCAVKPLCRSVKGFQLVSHTLQSIHVGCQSIVISETLLNVTQTLLQLIQAVQQYFSGFQPE